MHRNIKSRVDAHGKRLIRFLRELISIPSPGGGEEQVVRRIQAEMEKLEYDEIRVDAMGNLLGRMGDGSRILVFDGHCDTVAAGNLKNWSRDPYSGILKGGRIHGRGSSDQKGGLAAAVYAGRIIRDMGIGDEFSLWVVASVLEEDYEGLCWKHIIDKEKLYPEAVVLTEPSNMQIRIGQRGRMEMKLRINGISAHGSQPERGDNAIYKMAAVIREIDQLNGALLSESILGKGSITVTDIHSRAPSLCAVPDTAVIHMDRRLSEGESMKSCLREITVLPSLEKLDFQLSVPEYHVKSYTGLSFREKAFFPMWLMNENDPLVQAAVAAFEGQFGGKPEVGVWKFSTNGVATKGIHGIPTVGFGPGEEEAAHSPDESVKAQDLLRAAEFYVRFALGWIASGGGSVS